MSRRRTIQRQRLLQKFCLRTTFWKTLRGLTRSWLVT
ncbi:hypothetical protein PHMEG_00019738, partial [Phytophthora megakarya]